MLHPPPASVARPIKLTLCAALTAVVMLALAPGTASAACGSSTPTFLGPNQDGTGPDNVGGAPDIGNLNVTLDSACQLRVEPNLIPPSLTPNQYLIVQFAFDPPPPNPVDELIDVEVYVFSDGPYLDTGIDFIPLTPVSPTGFSISLDALGVPVSPMQLGIGVVGVFDPTPLNPFDLDETRGDYAPELTSFLHRLPVGFSAPPPPPPPPPPAPPATPAAAPKVVKAAGCVVPKLKGLTVKRAKAALKKAGCKYKLRGKGQVRSVSPKAGTRTEGTVQVKCKSKQRKRKRARRSGISRQDVRPAALRFR